MTVLTLSTSRSQDLLPRRLLDRTSRSPPRAIAPVGHLVVHLDVLVVALPPLGRRTVLPARRCRPRARPPTDDHLGLPPAHASALARRRPRDRQGRLGRRRGGLPDLPVARARAPDQGRARRRAGRRRGAPGGRHAVRARRPHRVPRAVDARAGRVPRVQGGPAAVGDLELSARARL